MNTTGLFRSNYFAVKDRPVFEQWCERMGLEVIEEKSDFVGFVDSRNESGIPWMTTQGANEEQVDCDFLAELADHLADGHVAIVIELVYEGYRYLGGTSYAINNKGELKMVMLSSITDLAKTLGEHVTECEY